MLKRTIGIVSPSFPRAARDVHQFRRAVRNLEEADYKVVIASNVLLDNGYISGTIEQRVEDIHEMFEHSEIDMILAASGGWNANDLLDRLEYARIAKSPKPFIGFSDNTVLLYALQARANVPVLYGPSLISGFSDTRFMTYTLRYLEEALSGREYDIAPADQISTANSLHKVSNAKANEGWITVHKGVAKGIIFGGNLGTLYLSCHTTDFDPYRNKDLILALEDDNESHGAMNYRHLRTLEHTGILQHVTGVLWGRDVEQTWYEPGYGLDWILKQFFRESVPIYTGVDFGHTMPFATLPLGRKCVVSEGLIRVMESENTSTVG